MSSAVAPPAVEAPALLVSLAAPAVVEAPHSLFDPARHMRVSEVRPGMKGYGLSVFSGSKIERFDVEVLSILHNFNPQHDVVLITCHGANLEHTGSIAGMSGSPIYLHDDQGRDRMIGAFAYGWPMAKDPIAGVQPIEYMLDLPVDRPTTRPASRPLEAAASIGPWRLQDAQKQTAALFAAPERADGAVGVQTRLGGNMPELQPLATPLMAGGLSPSVLKAAGPMLARLGMTPLQAGGGGGAAAAGARPDLKFAPGSVLAVPMMTGDSDLTAIGTVTEVLGDRVYGFGHPFNNEGPVNLPMGPGTVQGIIANLTTSFKLGSMSDAQGRLTADGAVGVGGIIGATPGMAPMDVNIIDADTGESHPYHFQASIHPKFTPLLAGLALSSAVGGASELPQYNTVDWMIDMEFANGRTVRLADRAVNVDALQFMQMPALPLMAAAENPFERVQLRKLSATLTVSHKVHDGTIVEVNMPRAIYKPGETVRAFVSFKPFRGKETVLPVEMELPKDLPAGVYRFIVSDADRFAIDEQTTQPFRFTAERIGDVFDVIQQVLGMRHDAIYLRLMRQQDGVAIGRTALPLLPSGSRQVLLAAGRSDTTGFVSSATKIVPVDRVMAGQAEFALTIETQPHGAAVHGHAPATPAPPAPHVEEPKASKPGGIDAPP